MGEINGRKVSWIHLSDLHFGGKNGSIPSNAVYDKLLRDIKNIKIPIDFVFVSGDIAFSASPDQYAYAEKFFNEVLDSLWGNHEDAKKRIFIVPGNHDIFRSNASNLWGKLIQPSSEDEIANLLEDSSIKSYWKSKFDNYNEFLKNLVGDETAAKWSDEPYFIEKRVKDGIKISIVGLNSAWSSSSMGEKGNIILGQRNVVNAYSSVDNDDGELVISFLHHPVSYFRDDDVGIVERVINAHSDFVLHGHIHDDKVYTSTSLEGEVHYIVSGTTYEKDAESYSYNYTSVDLDTGVCQTVLRKYDSNSLSWGPNYISSKHPDGIIEYPFRNHTVYETKNNLTSESKITNTAVETVETFTPSTLIGSQAQESVEITVPGVPKGLSSSLKEQNCILFSGAGASADGKLPIWYELVHAFVEQVKDNYPDLEERKLAEIQALMDHNKTAPVVYYCRKKLGSSDFADVISKKLSTANKESYLQSLLSKIPFSAVITANFDDFAEKYCSRENGAYKVILPDKMSARSGSDNKFPIYKIHGSCDEPDSIRIMDNEFIELIDNEEYRRTLSDLFVNNTVFFVGYSFKDPDVDYILRSLRTRNIGKKHYALMPDVNEIEREFFLDAYNIQVISYPSIGKHKAVRLFLEKLLS
ncbi:SIR2 family protein [Butyrivibrio sp. DSM 10294]|uniref:SIR2 family protein n=1 Tax=Butyrivibrio sp. DSM 10294 TaxID=2972457 RepID=UPI00234EAE05|nr:SIR2 family protein [Butyrivibrio sp. DSM 10294]MDC7293234.1 SIR2 family protein [Butyrivibrio sp. DSM 10294]